MKPKKLIYIKESKDYAAGWITPRKLKNAIARGEKIKVNDNNKKLIKTYKNEIKNQQPQKNEPPRREKIPANVTGDRQNRYKEPKQDETKTKQSITSKRNEQPEQAIKTAPPVIINQSAINELSRKVRKPDGTYFSREYYLELEKKRIEGKSKVDDFLKTLDKKYNATIIKEVTEYMFFYQTGNFIEILKETIGELKTGATISITDFDGDEGIPHTSTARALSIISALNSLINEALRLIQSEHKKAEIARGIEPAKVKPLSIYILIPETIKSNSKGFVLSVKYDYSKWDIIGDISYEMFDYVLNGNGQAFSY